MNIKIPFCIDTSYWEIIPDFGILNPKPFLAITRATLGVSYKDPTFHDYLTDIQSDGIHDGCYHYFVQNLNSSEQANNFLAHVNGYIQEDTLLILDVEQEGITAPQMWTWFEKVRARYPRNTLLLYGRKELLDRIPMTASEKEYFKKIPVWTAGYPNNPDLFDSPPPYYIPNQTMYGPVWLWQYTESLILTGITGECDANWVSPSLVSHLGGYADSASVPYQGVTWIQGIRPGGSRDIKFHLLLIEMPYVQRSLVTYTNGSLIRTTAAADQYGAQIAVNGDGWEWRNPYPHRPYCFAVSDGFAVPVDYPYEENPFLKITANGQISMPDTRASRADAKNAVSGFRYLVRDGVKAAYLNGTEPVYTERHARSVKGITKNGRLMLMVCDGTYTMEYGLKLSEVADILLQYGAWVASDNDSGGSSTMVIDGQMVNTPSDPEERAVVNHLLLWFVKESSMYLYDATALGDGTRLRDDHNTSGSVIASYPKGTVFSGNTLFVATEQLINSSGQVYQLPGDKWLQVIEINGQPKTGWVAIIHMGGPICTLKENPVPPAGKPITVIVDVDGYKPKTFTDVLEPE